MFIQAGAMKLFAFPIGMPPDGGTAPLMSQTGIGGLLEFAGGILLLLGLFTRPVAFVVSGEMAVAYFPRAAELLADREPGPAGRPLLLHLALPVGCGTWTVESRRRPDKDEGVACLTWTGS
jgi:hypothetical protein